MRCIGGIFALGVLGSICGGYISAWIAKRQEVLHGALAAWLCVVRGIFALTSAQTANETGLGMLAIPLSFSMCAVGGWLRKRQTVARA